MVSGVRYCKKWDFLWRKRNLQFETLNSPIRKVSNIQKTFRWQYICIWQTTGIYTYITVVHFTSFTNNGLCIFFNHNPPLPQPKTKKQAMILLDPNGWHTFKKTFPGPMAGRFGWELRFGGWTFSTKVLSWILWTTIYLFWL